MPGDPGDRTAKPLDDGSGAMMGEKGAMSEVEIPIHDPHIPVSVDPAQSVVGTSSSSSLLYPDGAGIHSVSP